MAVVDSNRLELLSLNPRGYWMYAYAAPMYSGVNSLGLALDSGGAPHVCYYGGGSQVYFW
jgi:hypothetical protein